MGFNAVFTVEKNDSNLGKLNVSWKRGEEKVSATLEAEAQDQEKTAAEALVGDHVLSLLV